MRVNHDPQSDHKILPLWQPRSNSQSQWMPWDTDSACAWLESHHKMDNRRSAERYLTQSNLIAPPYWVDAVRDEHDRALKPQVVAMLLAQAAEQRIRPLVVQQFSLPNGGCALFANDEQRNRQWIPFLQITELSLDAVQKAVMAFSRHAEDQPLMIFPYGTITVCFRAWVSTARTHTITLPNNAKVIIALTAYAADTNPARYVVAKRTVSTATRGMTHLARLEAESMYIMREVMAEAENPAMLYSIGKDSSVMLHLARKAFYPSPPPFPLLHVDTRWKFQQMYAFRDWTARESGMKLLVHTNPEGVKKNINPFDHGSALHTDVMKTQALRQALDQHRFDVVFGGARRDEEKSRAKERIFSFRTAAHRWDPKNQRPELWNLYNGRKREGESIRVFPLSNWTELDIWQYIYCEGIPIVPLYFAAERPVIQRDGVWIMIDDARISLLPGEEVEIRRMRFRTLGCYPLTGAILSDADDLPSIVLELLQSRTSERQGRAIDNDSAASMEKKKQEGYF